MSSYVRPDGTLGDALQVVESAAPDAMRVRIVDVADIKIELAPGATYEDSAGNLQRAVPVVITEAASYVHPTGVRLASVPAMMDAVT